MLFQSLFPALGEVPEINVHNFIFDHVHKDGLVDYDYLVDANTGSALKSNDFLQRVRDGATALQAPEALALDKDRHVVGIVSENCIEYVVLVHSLMASTIPVVPLSSYGTTFELAYLLRQSKVTHLFVHPRLLSLVRTAAKEVGLPDDHIYLLERKGNHAQGPRRRSLDDWIGLVHSKRIPRAPVRHAPKDTLAYLMFSSGTSGKPKAVMVSHQNIISQLLQFAVCAGEAGKVAPPPPPLTQTEMVFLPFHHTYGLNLVCFRSLLSPVRIVVVPKWDTKRGVELIRKYKVTRLSLIPSIVHQIVVYLSSLPASKDRDNTLKSLTSVGSGAAYLPPQLAEQMKSFAPNVPQVMQGWGMSECTMTGIVCLPDGTLGRTRWAQGSVGNLFPSMEARLLKPDGTEAEVNEPGELYLRGPNVAMGYWGKEFEQQTRETFLPGGWLRTGDVFRVDEFANFHFEDRAKDTLKVSGMQVAPTEIEDVLLAHPEGLVLDASVAGVSGGRTDDEKLPRAWVVLSPAGKRKGRKETLAALEAWTHERLSKYKWLRGGIEVVNEIPKSPTGKVLRRVLVEKHEQRKKKEKAKL